MFSLIITIISIALVIAVSLATLYYGGSAFTNGGASAAAAGLMNVGQQITGANTLYANAHGGSFATGMATLTAEDVANGNVKYMKSEPSISASAATSGVIGLGATTADNYVTVTNLTDGVCDAVNAKSGYSKGAAVANVAGAAGAVASFGCQPATAGGNVFVYKG